MSTTSTSPSTTTSPPSSFDSNRFRNLQLKRQILNQKEDFRRIQKWHHPHPHLPSHSHSHSHSSNSLQRQQTLNSSTSANDYVPEPKSNIISIKKGRIKEQQNVNIHDMNVSTTSTPLLSKCHQPIHQTTSILKQFSQPSSSSSSLALSSSLSSSLLPTPSFDGGHNGSISSSLPSLSLASSSYTSSMTSSSSKSVQNNHKNRNEESLTQISKRIRHEQAMALYKDYHDENEEEKNNNNDDDDHNNEKQRFRFSNLWNDTKEGKRHSLSSSTSINTSSSSSSMRNVMKALNELSRKYDVHIYDNDNDEIPKLSSSSSSSSTNLFKNHRLHYGNFTILDMSQYHKRRRHRHRRMNRQRRKRSLDEGNDHAIEESYYRNLQHLKDNNDDDDDNKSNFELSFYSIHDDYDDGSNCSRNYDDDDKSLSYISLSSTTSVIPTSTTTTTTTTTNREDLNNQRSSSWSFTCTTTTTTKNQDYLHQLEWMQNVEPVLFMPVSKKNNNDDHDVKSSQYSIHHNHHHQQEYQYRPQQQQPQNDLSELNNCSDHHHIHPRVIVESSSSTYNQQHDNDSSIISSLSFHEFANNNLQQCDNSKCEERDCQRRGHNKSWRFMLIVLFVGIIGSFSTSYLVCNGGSSDNNENMTVQVCLKDNMLAMKKSIESSLSLYMVEEWKANMIKLQDLKKTYNHYLDDYLLSFHKMFQKVDEDDVVVTKEDSTITTSNSYWSWNMDASLIGPLDHDESFSVWRNNNITTFVEEYHRDDIIFHIQQHRRVSLPVLNTKQTCPFHLNEIKQKDLAFGQLTYQVEDEMMMLFPSHKLRWSSLKKLVMKLNLICLDLKIVSCQHLRSYQNVMNIMKEPEQVLLTQEVCPSFPIELESKGIEYIPTCPAVIEKLKYKDIGFQSIQYNLENGFINIISLINQPTQRKRLTKRIFDINPLMKVIFITSDDPLNNKSDKNQSKQPFWSSSPRFLVKSKENITKHHPIGGKHLETSEAARYDNESTQSQPCFLSDLDPNHVFPGIPSDLYCKYPEYVNVAVVYKQKNFAIEYLNEQADDFHNFHLLDTIVDFFHTWRKHREERRRISRQRSSSRKNNNSRQMEVAASYHYLR